jgi:hypothetical protein
MDVSEQLNALPEMNKAALAALWRAHFGAPPPEQIRRDLIIRVLAYKIQEQAFGGLSSSIRRRLRQFASAIEKDPNSTICACLIGTLGHAKGLKTEDEMRKKICPAIPYYDMGLHNPSEQWFWQIRRGDTPEENQFATHAVKLIDSVLGTSKKKSKKSK